MFSSTQSLLAFRKLGLTLGKSRPVAGSTHLPSQRPIPHPQAETPMPTQLF